MATGTIEWFGDDQGDEAEHGPQGPAAAPAEKL
jgi:hypothetical protein